MVSWGFLTNHARALLCIAHDPGTRLRDIAARLDITERSAHGIIADLTAAGYLVKQKDGRRNRYQIQAHLGPQGWAAFGKAAGRSEGLRGAAELFPWILDGAPAGTRKRLLGMLPAPARLLYRAVWRPGYARTPRWEH